MSKLGSHGIRWSWVPAMAVLAAILAMEPAAAQARPRLAELKTFDAAPAAFFVDNGI